MEAGWRIDSSGVADVLERGDDDARLLSAALSAVSVSLDEATGVLDDVVGAALRRLHEQWQPAASSVDRRTVAVLETARTVVRDHLVTDDDMAARFTSSQIGADDASNRFAPRTAP